jgi:hypothetical protein
MAVLSSIIIRLTGRVIKRVTPFYTAGTLGALGTSSLFRPAAHGFNRVLVSGLTLTATTFALRWVWEGVSAKFGL